MEGSNSRPQEKRIAVVTGGNKGIGFGICQQLASNGIRVILTARDEKRGIAAVEKLKNSGLSDVVFHRLDVTDSSSIASLADFIKTQFGKLDILVNNAGILGVTIDPEILKSPKPTNEEEATGAVKVGARLSGKPKEPYELAEECLKINFYGTKNVTEALLPLLLSSYTGRVVNVSSSYGRLKYIPNEGIRQRLNDVDDLSKDRLDEIVESFLKDYTVGLLEANQWPTTCSAYIVSKALVNAYTRLMAKRYPALCINCLCPGFVKTDLTYNLGILSVEEAAKGPVVLALLPHGSPSGFFFDKTELSTF